MTGCVNTMSGSAPITINPLPVAFTMTGGGSYCSGGTGVSIGLSSSNVGVSYQLYNGTATVGAPVTGTGAPLSFGMHTAAGNYTVRGTNTSTTCWNTMSGSAIIVVNTLPTAYTVTGGGNYCPGGAGVVVGLSGSNAANTYQLYRGITAIGSPVPGSGSAISFGLQTAAGTYTVIATNAATLCRRTMTGSATISINPLPVVQIITGGGSFCSGGAGVPVGLSGSVSGILYQLYNGGTPVGSPMVGTGGAISFGLKTVPGVYTATATNTVTACSSNMSGSATIVINPLPPLNNVTGGGSYCAGGAGLSVGLDGSVVGVTYQVYNGTISSGVSMPGTGLPLDFGIRTTAGTYTIIATDDFTGCTSTMTGSAVVTVDPLPEIGRASCRERV